MFKDRGFSGEIKMEVNEKEREKLYINKLEALASNCLAQQNLIPVLQAPSSLAKTMREGRNPPWVLSKSD